MPRIGPRYLDKLRGKLVNGGRYNVRLSNGFEMRATFFTKTEVDVPHFIHGDQFYTYEEAISIQEADKPGAARHSPSNFDPEQYRLLESVSINPYGEVP